MDKSKILFFMIPRQKVIHVFDDFTLEEALCVMKSTRFSAIPILSRDNKYIGTLSEGDILWFIKSIPGFSFENTETLKIMDIPRLRQRSS
jgi:CBS domain-containing protein